MDTTTQVLSIFLSNPDKNISGQYISEKLSISRNAVWKAMEQLRRNGYIIQGLTNKGYQLVKVPNKIDKYYLQATIQGSHLNNFCSEIIVLDKVNSTNELLKEKADTGQSAGTVIIAHEQDNGRGRLGRVWESQKGGLWFSLLLRPTLPMEELSMITLSMAAGVSEGIRDYTGLNIEIKWPNDILYKGKKIAGILTEVKGDMDGVEYVVIGIGINVNNSIPDGLKQKATSLNEINGEEILINNLLTKILLKIEKYSIAFSEGHIGEILEINRRNSSLIGKEVVITGVKGKERGIVLDISQDGALIIKDDNENIKQVVSGDVSLSSWY